MEERPQPPPVELGYGRYDPPISKRARPAVILWYRTYSIVSLLLYLSFVVQWQVFSPARLEGIGPAILIGLGITAFFGVGALVPYKPWGWTYGLIVIAAGMIGCLFMLSIPLVIFWSRPETKAAFARV